MKELKITESEAEILKGMAKREEDMMIVSEPQKLPKFKKLKDKIANL